MIIATTPAEVALPGNDATTSFSSGIQVEASDDLLVYLRDTVAETETLLTEDVDYEVQNLTSTSGVTIAYPLTGDPLTSTEKLIIRRVSSELQDTDFTTQRGYNPDGLEAALARITLRLQELDDRVARKFGVGQNSGVTAVDLPWTTGSAGFFKLTDAGAISLVTGVAPDDVTVSAFMETVLDDASADAALATLGFSAYMYGLKATADQTSLQTALGISTFIKTLIDDTDAATARATLELVLASAANIRAATANRVMQAAEFWSSQAEVALTDAASIAVDLSAGINFTLTLTADRQLANPTNAKVGQEGWIRITHAGFDLSYDSQYEFDYPISPNMNFDGNAETRLYYKVLTATRILITSAQRVWRFGPEATTSGTAVGFTGLPSGIRRARLGGTGVSFTGNAANLLIQLSTGATFVTSGYEQGSGTTSGFEVTLAGGSAWVSGFVEIMRLGSTNTYQIEGRMVKTTTASTNVGGEVALGGELDGIQVARSATDTFDAGSIYLELEFD